MSGYLLKFGPMRVLLDIGAGVLRRLVEANEDFRTIDAICITHLHIDHISDLVPFLWATRYTPDFQRKKKLTIFGPRGIIEWYRRLAEVHGEWLLQLPFDLEILEKKAETWPFHQAQIQTLPMKHSVEANGYRFTLGESAIAYSGDTGYCPELVELAFGVDLLLIECSFPDDQRQIDTHLTPAGVARVGNQSGARRIVLTHMYPECEDHDLAGFVRGLFPGPVELAEDLQRYTI